MHGLRGSFTHKGNTTVLLLKALFWSGINQIAATTSCLVSSISRAATKNLFITGLKKKSIRESIRLEKPFKMTRDQL